MIILIFLIIVSVLIIFFLVNFFILNTKKTKKAENFKKSGFLHPITFSIPEEKIVNKIYPKSKVLSDLIPGKIETYIYNNETDYYNEYKKSLFAKTTKKGGWDCLRHYEIMANGCIPYFPDIEKCPEKTMFILPKDLIKEGNNLYYKYKDKKLSEIDLDICYKLINKFLEYTRNNLTTEKIAKYILDKTSNNSVTKILFLSGKTDTDYLRCLTLHGFKKLFGKKFHDYPKITHIYKSYNKDIKLIYGKGITYSKLLDDNLHDLDRDKTVIKDIENKYYDIIIYGSFHRGMPYYDEVVKKYDSNKIILLCGEDLHKCVYQKFVTKGHHVFVRELE
jgi:hypothetical protein